MAHFPHFSSTVRIDWLFHVIFANDYFSYTIRTAIRSHDVHLQMTLVCTESHWKSYSCFCFYPNTFFKLIVSVIDILCPNHREQSLVFLKKYLQPNSTTPSLAKATAIDFNFILQKDQTLVESKLTLLILFSQTDRIYLWVLQDRFVSGLTNADSFATICANCWMLLAPLKTISETLACRYDPTQLRRSTATSESTP